MAPPSLAAQGLRSLYFFAQRVCGFTKLVPQLHGEMAEEMEEYLWRKRQPLGIVIPRDHFKSTLGLAACAWMATKMIHEENDYGFRTLIDCATQDLSRKHVQWIGRLFAHDRTYRKIYGEYLEPGEWSRDEIYFTKRKESAGETRDPNFKATSVRSERTGGHYDLHWYDDLVGERNFGTKHLRNVVAEHFYSSLQILEPTGRLLYTGTPWHDGDILGRLRKQQKDRVVEGLDKTFHFYRRAALEDKDRNPDDKHGEPIFPERFSKEFLLTEKKGKLPKFMWSAQWMTDSSLPDYALPFNRDYMYRHRDSFPTHLRIKMMTVDPNFRNEDQLSGDNAAILVGGLDAKANWWGIDLRIGQWQTKDLIKEILDTFEQWRPQLVRIEKKFTSHLMTALHNEASSRGYMLPVELIERDWRGKDTRFASLQPLFASNRIFFASEIGKLVKEELEEELEKCGSSAHDDILDALADQFQGGMAPIVAAETETFVTMRPDPMKRIWSPEMLGFIQLGEGIPKQPTYQEPEEGYYPWT